MTGFAFDDDDLQELESIPATHEATSFDTCVAPVLRVYTLGEQTSTQQQSPSAALQEVQEDDEEGNSGYGDDFDEVEEEDDENEQ